MAEENVGKMQFINNRRRCENAIIFMRNTLCVRGKRQI